ncbi:hypothetical protein ACOSP7_020485 [Xanthoceras sorbifolium]
MVFPSFPSDACFAEDLAVSIKSFQSGAGVSVSMTLAFAKNLLNALPIAEVTNWSRSITFCLNVFTHLKNTIGC